MDGGTVRGQRVTRLAVALVSIYFGLVSLATEAQARSEVADIDKQRAKLAEATLKQISSRHGEALYLLRSVIESDSFASLDEDERLLALHGAGTAALARDRAREGHSYFVRATESPAAGGKHWVSRSVAADAARNREDAAFSLIQAAERGPDALLHVKRETILRIMYLAGRLEKNVNARPALMQALLAASEHSEELCKRSDLWLDLVRVVSEHPLSATSLDKTLHDYLAFYHLPAINADVRFDRIVAANPDFFDVYKAQERRLSGLRTAVERSPRSAEVLTDYIGALLDADRSEEAELLAADVMIRKAHTDGSVFWDRHDFANWFQDYRARALWQLERYPESIALYEKAATIDERGDETNISQALNLASRYLEMGGRADESLRLAKRLRENGNLNNWGRGTLAEVLALAAAQAGKQEDAEKWLRLLAQEKELWPRIYNRALVRMDRMDEAAAFLIARLQDPIGRFEALSEVQDYRRPRAPVRYAQEWQSRWEQLIARPDVRAAVDAVGRIRSYDIWMY